MADNEWISVKDALPNKCGVYNVTRRIIDGRTYNYVTSCYFDGSDTWHDDNRVNHSREYVNNIIAWQPLPEPYEEV